MAKKLLGVVVCCLLSFSLLDAQCPRPTPQPCPTFSGGCPGTMSYGACRVPIDWFFKHSNCVEGPNPHSAIHLNTGNQLAITQPDLAVFPDFTIGFSRYPTHAPGTEQCSGAPGTASGAFTPAPGDNFSNRAPKHTAVAMQNGCYKLQVTYQSGGMTCSIDPHIIVGQ